MSLSQRQIACNKTQACRHHVHFFFQRSLLRFPAVHSKFCFVEKKKKIKGAGRERDRESYSRKGGKTSRLQAETPRAESSLRGVRRAACALATRRTLFEVSEESETRPDATPEWECKRPHGALRRAYETPLLVSGISQNATINKQTHRVGRRKGEKERARRGAHGRACDRCTPFQGESAPTRSQPPRCRGREGEEGQGSERGDPGAVG